MGLTIDRNILKQRSGGCKGLSLLPMSMLTAADIDESAKISNGHMWICVDLDGTTTIRHLMIIIARKRLVWYFCWK
jgi:hypothetical protein